MTYITSSITSATPALDLYTAMASALSTAGYTLVDTVTIGSNTHKVWKSPAAGNSLGLDWYLDVVYNAAGTTQLNLAAFEFYDPATHLGYRGPYNHGSDTTNPETTYYTRYGATGFALETNWSTINNNPCRIPVQTSAFAYWISITTDRVIAMTSVRPSDVNYCGFYDTYAPYLAKIGALNYPLLTATVNAPGVTNSSSHSASSNMPVPPTLNSNSNPAATTRRPLWAVGSSQGIWYNLIQNTFLDNSPTSNTEGGTGYGGPTGKVDTGVYSYTDAPRGANLALTFTTASGIVLCAGLLKDLCLFVGSAVTRGDTISISGVDWVMATTGASVFRQYGFKAS